MTFLGKAILSDFSRLFVELRRLRQVQNMATNCTVANIFRLRPFRVRAALAVRQTSPPSRFLPRDPGNRRLGDRPPCRAARSRPLHREDRQHRRNPGTFWSIARAEQHRSQAPRVAQHALVTRLTRYSSTPDGVFISSFEQGEIGPISSAPPATWGSRAPSRSARIGPIAQDGRRTGSK